MTTGPRKMLIVFIDETDEWQNEKLYAVIVRVLERNDIAGATVISGIMGYGTHREIHRKGLFGVPDDKPVAIIAIDEEEKLRAVLPQLVPMVIEGLISLHDTEVVFSGTGARR